MNTAAQTLVRGNDNEKPVLGRVLSWGVFEDLWKNVCEIRTTKLLDYSD